MSARALIVSAPRSGSGKTTRDSVGLLRALSAAGRARCGRPRRDRTISIPRFHAAATGAAGPQSRQLGDAAGELLDGLVAEAARAPTGARRGRHGPVRRRARRAGPKGRGRRSRARATACRCCWCSTSPASRRPPRRSPTASPPMIRRCGSPASCSTGSPASATACCRGGDRGDRRAGRRRDAARRDDVAARAPSRPGAGRRACRPRRRGSTGSPTRWSARRPRRDPRRSPRRPIAAAARRHGAAAARQPHRARRDAAFTFIYPHVLAGWRRAGAEIVAVLAARRRAAARTTATPAGCRAAIPSCMPARSRRRAASATGCGASPRPGRSMASAAATWCSARRWRMPTATRHAWPACSATSPASPSAGCTSATARRGSSPMRRSAEAGEIVRGHEFHYSSLVEAGGDAPLVGALRRPGAVDRPGRRPARPRHRHVFPRHRHPLRVKAPLPQSGALSQNRHLVGLQVPLPSLSRLLTTRPIPISADLCSRRGVIRSARRKEKD